MYTINMFIMYNHIILKLNMFFMFIACDAHAMHVTNHFFGLQDIVNIVFYYKYACMQYYVCMCSVCLHCSCKNSSARPTWRWGVPKNITFSLKVFSVCFNFKLSKFPFSHSMASKRLRRDTLPQVHLLWMRVPHRVLSATIPLSRIWHWLSNVPLACHYGWIQQF